MNGPQSGKLTRGATYLVIVTLAACVDLGGFALLHHAGLMIPIAAVASFVVAAVLNYTLSARLVFAARWSLRGLRTFLVVGTGGLVVNAAVTSLASLAGVAPVWAKAIAIGVAFFVNLSGNVFIVFRKRESSSWDVLPP